MFNILVINRVYSQLLFFSVNNFIEFGYNRTFCNGMRIKIGRALKEAQSYCTCP
jgi:hypothetical protein